MQTCHVFSHPCRSKSQFLFVRHGSALLWRPNRLDYKIRRHSHVPGIVASHLWEAIKFIPIDACRLLEYKPSWIRDFGVGDLEIRARHIPICGSDVKVEKMKHAVCVRSRC